MESSLPTREKQVKSLNEKLFKGRGYIGDGEELGPDRMCWPKPQPCLDVALFGFSAPSKVVQSESLIPYLSFAGRFWDAQNSKSLSLGSPGSPVTKMVAVAGKLWCGCQNRVIILNTSTLQQQVGNLPVLPLSLIHFYPSLCGDLLPSQLALNT